MTERGGNLRSSNPGNYIAGLHGIEVSVPMRVAAWLARNTNLLQARRNHPGADPEIDAVLQALAFAAQQWRACVTASEVDAAAQAVASSSMWVGVRSVADLLGITESAVRLAIAERRLDAQKVDGYRWSINLADVELFRAKRPTT